MNCCNEYGECKQGKGCPVREEHYKDIYGRVWDVLCGMLFAIALFSVTGVAAFLIGRFL